MLNQLRYFVNTILDDMPTLMAVIALLGFVVMATLFVLRLSQ